MTNLLKSKIGRWQKISGFSNDIPLKIKRRLMELGFIASQNVKVLRKSLFGKTFMLEIRNITLLLRKEIVCHILVE